MIFLFFFFLYVINEIALKKCKSAHKHTESIQGHQNKRKNRKQRKNTRKNPKDIRRAILNPQPLASNLTRTHTPSIKTLENDLIKTYTSWTSRVSFPFPNTPLYKPTYIIARRNEK
jgi:hypothetical protein